MELFKEFIPDDKPKEITQQQAEHIEHLKEIL